METIIVNGIVFCAALYLARWLFRNMASRKEGAACGSCDSCEPEDNTALAQHPDTTVPSTTSHK